jgi:hypothetical protein
LIQSGSDWPEVCIIHPVPPIIRPSTPPQTLGTAIDFDLEASATALSTPTRQQPQQQPRHTTRLSLSSSSSSSQQQLQQLQQQRRPALSPPLLSTSTTQGIGEGGPGLSGPSSSFLPLPDPTEHTPSKQRRELEALGVVLQVLYGDGGNACAGVCVSWS